jgi:Protein of unknown function (DUF4232)
MTRSARAARTLIAAAALACPACLVAACGSASSTASSSGTTATGAAATPTSTTRVAASAPPNSASPTTPPTTTGPPPCATSALRVSVGPSGGAAAGSSFYPIEFTNVSGASCTLYGYPGVSFVTGVGGTRIGIPATENPANPRRLITLAAGRTGHAELQVVAAQNYPQADCGLVTAHWLRVYPPNQTAPLYVRFTAPTCTKPRTILSVQTVQTHASGT